MRCRIPGLFSDAWWTVDCFNSVDTENEVSDLTHFHDSADDDPILCDDFNEQAIFDFRFLALFAVVGSLAGSLLCFLNVLALSLNSCFHGPFPGLV